MGQHANRHHSRLHRQHDSAVVSLRSALVSRTAAFAASPVVYCANRIAYLWGNQLTGTIPSTIGALPNLKYVTGADEIAAWILLTSLTDMALRAPQQIALAVQSTERHDTRWHQSLLRAAEFTAVRQRLFRPDSRRAVNPDGPHVRLHLHLVVTAAHVCVYTVNSRVCRTYLASVS